MQPLPRGERATSDVVRQVERRMDASNGGKRNGIGVALVDDRRLRSLVCVVTLMP
jgi:hypothetical protein